ncbi:hypothetical protein M9Y10_015377 [Tritrichomonas musculus]|uniref:Uncharacterized protein n=1 Tax=Tritrichomonas musculus TaxID=1915356 RepID=A0ABR2L248_9EUKA
MLHFTITCLKQQRQLANTIMDTFTKILFLNPNQNSQSLLLIMSILNNVNHSAFSFHPSSSQSHIHCFYFRQLEHFACSTELNTEFLTLAFLQFVESRNSSK